MCDGNCSKCKKEKGGSYKAEVALVVLIVICLVVIAFGHS